MEDSFRGIKTKAEKKIITAVKQKRMRGYRKLAEDRLNGMSNKEIAKKHGLSASRVEKVLSKEEVVAMLDRAYLKMATAVPEVTNNIIEAALDFRKKRDADGEERTSEDKKISWEANKLIAQAHGMLPTSSQSVVHNTFINQQTNNVIPPVIAELAAKHFGGFVNIPKQIPEVIDVQE
jgi:hypothetical protein